MFSLISLGTKYRHISDEFQVLIERFPKIYLPPILFKRLTCYNLPSRDKTTTRSINRPMLPIFYFLFLNPLDYISKSVTARPPVHRVVVVS